MVKYRHANRQRPERQLSANQRFVDMMIVPFSIQLVIENVLKHNVISATMPMTITISIKEDAITVSNPYQTFQL